MLMMMSIDREEATIKFSFPDRKSVEKTSNKELLVIIPEGITCLPSCRRTSCDCLGILSDVNDWECVQQYLLQFMKKSKHGQDSIILEWYKYEISARVASMIGGSQPLWFCLPYPRSHDRRCPQSPPPLPWLIVMFLARPRSILMEPVVGSITHDPINVRH